MRKRKSNYFGKVFITETAFGYLGSVYYRSDSLFSIILPTEHDDLLSRVSIFHDGAEISYDKTDLGSDLSDYFAGKKIDFSSYKIDLTGYTDFSIKVYNTLRSEVGYGEVTSYSKLAELVKNRRYSRSTGMILSRNRIPLLIPCHRVIRSDGTIGGFSGAGLDMKRRLIEIES